MKTCYICGKPQTAHELCVSHYRMIYSRKIDFKDREKIIETIKEIENKKCYICGGVKFSKGLCRNHYERARIREVDLNNREKVKQLISDLDNRKLCSKCGKRKIFKDDICVYCLNGK